MSLPLASSRSTVNTRDVNPCCLCSSHARSSIGVRCQVSVLVLFVAALVMSLVTSCAVRPPAHVAGEKAPCPAKTINLLKRTGPNIHSVKATLEVYFTADEPGHNQRLQVGLAAKRPDRMRLNVYAGFLSLVNIAVDGESLWVFLPSSSTLLAGSLDEAAGQALFPMATGLLLDAVRTILFPDPFCITGCTSDQIERGKCRFEEESEDGKRIGIIESRTGRLLSLDLVDRDGTERVAVNYRDYRRSGGISFPHDITVSLPSDGVRVRLLFNRAVLNRHIDETEFRLKDLSSATVTRFQTLWK